MFVAKVKATDDSQRVAGVEVLSVWKGRDLPQFLDVMGAASADAPVSASDRRFEVGTTYLVIPENSREPFLASACSATQVFTGAPSAVPPPYQDAVGSISGRLPIFGESSEVTERNLTASILPLLGAIALIALVWALMLKMRSLAPQRATSFAESTAPQRPRREPKVKVGARSLKRDVEGAEKLTKKKVRKHSRFFSFYRMRQNRQVAAARKARGSTDNS